MIFNTSILTESEVYAEADSVENNSDSYLYNLLEFNDDLHSIYINDKLDYYRFLKESVNDNTVNENKEGFIQKIKRIFNAIISFIKKFIQSIFIRDSEIRNKYISSRNKIIKNLMNSDKIKTYKIYHYPQLVDLDAHRIRSTITNITEQIDRILKGGYSYKATETSLSTAYKGLFMIVKKNASRHEVSKFNYTKDGFTEFVKSDVIYAETKEINGKEMADIIDTLSISTKSDIAKAISVIESDLEKYNNKLRDASSLNSEETKNIEDLIAQINNIVSSWTWYINYIYETETKNLKYLLKFAGAGIISMESGYIHGESFDSETLFDNEDIRDFNPTEWLDLQLTTEIYELKFQMDESDRNIAVREASIMIDSDPLKFSRLVSMREAEEKKFAITIKQIIDKVREIIEGFISRITNKIKNIKELNTLIAKAKNKNITFDTRSDGDIIAGSQRVSDNITIEPFNYDVMKEDLSSKEVFFKKYILPKLNKPSNMEKRNVKYEDKGSITDFLKCYYGASMGSMDKCEFTANELESNKNLIITFIENATRIANQAKSDLNKLENAVNRAASVHNESMYYSSLYKRWFTEAEIERGEITSDNKKSNEGYNAGLKNYFECYKDLIMARSTAIDFITSEFTQIIKAI